MRHYLLLALLITTLAACAPESKQGRTATEETTKAADGPAPEKGSGVASDSARNAVSPDALIVPGHSIGGTRLGESCDSVHARLGQPDDGDAAMGKSMSTWYAGHKRGGHQTSVFCTRQMGTDDEEVSRVRQIFVTSPFFKTAEGLGPGSALKDISWHYRLRQASTVEEGGRRYRMMETESGIAWEIGTYDRCTGVAVQQPGDGAGTYLPFRPDAKPVD